MDPFTIYVAASLAGGALDSVKSYLGATSQAASYRETAYQHLSSIRALERQSAAQVEQMQKSGEKLKSEQRLGYLSGGLDISVGTPLKVLAETAYDIQKDISTYKANVEVEKAQLRSQAYQGMRAARNTSKYAPLNAAVPLIKAGSTAAISGYKGKTKLGDAPTTTDWDFEKGAGF